MKAALVGCGSISHMHLEALAKMPEVTLVGLCDIKKSMAENAKALYQKAASSANTVSSENTANSECNIYSSLAEMLDVEKPDVLHICTPHYLHVPMIEEACKRGISVFTEKPPAMTREHFKRLEACAGKIPIGICFQNRYNTSTQILRNAILHDNPGAFLGGKAFVTWHRTKEYYMNSPWRGDKKTEGGGALINQSIHTLDLLAYLLGRPDAVEAKMQNVHLKGCISVEDTVTAYMGFKGAPCLFYATTAYCTDSPIFMELVYENMTLRMGKDHVTIVGSDGKEVKHDLAANNGPEGKSYWGMGHEACISDYYHALAAGEKPPIGVDEVRNTMMMMYDIYDSADEAKSAANTHASDMRTEKTIA